MRGVYHFIASEVPPLELVSLLKELSLHLLFDFPLGFCSFTCDDPPLLLLLDHLLIEVAPRHAQSQQF